MDVKSTAPATISNPKGVYAITPVIGGGWAPDALLECVEAVLAGGVSWMQYRQKDISAEMWLELACDIGALVSKYGANLILNDASELVEISNVPGCVGVHLGKDDLPVAQARKRWGDGIVVGASCYNQWAVAQQSVAQGASYLAFGAMYPSRTKPLALRAMPELITQAKQAFILPCVAIGGIELDKVQALRSAGADALALVGALFGDRPNPDFSFAQAKAWVDVMNENGE